MEMWFGRGRQLRAHSIQKGKSKNEKEETKNEE
jgi:hypothetical protein